MATVVRSTACPLDCPDTCSLAVTVTDGRIVDIDAAPGNPLTDGWICAKVKRHADRVYAPERIMTPLIRSGPKGSGQFREATWDEAVKLVTGRIQQTMDTTGPAAVIPFLYNSSAGKLAAGALTERLFRTLGTAVVEPTICAATVDGAWRSTFGDMLSADPVDVVHARLVVIWGANPTVSNTHFPPLVRRAVDAGAKVVVIDPRRTAMAARADLHLAVRPGTDVVLAYAVAHILDRDERLDRSFLNTSSAGFEEFLTEARAWSPHRAGEVCGLDVEAIETFARWFGSISPTFLRLGWGQERNANGGAACRAILALPVLAGHFGEVGAGVMSSTSDAAPLALRHLDPVVAGGFADRVSLPLHQVGAWLSDPSTPTEVLFVSGANPAVMCPDQTAVLRALAREDLFTVVHEQVMTDTARYADVVLPATTHFEADDIATSYGSMTLQPITAVIDRVGQSRTNDEVASALAIGLGLEPLDFDPDPARLLAQAVTDGHGSGPRLVRGRTVQFVDTMPTDGRAVLVDPVHGIPRYRMLDSAYPLSLISPATARTINSMFGEFQSPEPVLRLHPSDAVERGLQGGEMVRVWNDLGQITVRCAVDDALRPGVASMPKGAWIRAYGTDGVTVNALMPSTADELVGGACFNDARVEVEFIRSGE